MNSTRVFSVSELTRKIKVVLESGFQDVSVQGEISNFKRHSSGHVYFTLKDEGAQLSAVMWRGRASSLFFTPQDGMKVIARGNITVYEIRGQYQIDVVQLQPLGIGELQLAFEQLKRKLAKEGLFDDDHKVPLPEYPERIGIVTSPTGAAIKDMVNIISRRFPAVELILYPVSVQGSAAAEEIAQAIRDFNEWGSVDVLIVGRGGGSLEDLWAFNEEIVARAIYESEIPIISAVGHEIDFTIADFVADLRAPTPSAAAELVVKSRFELFDIVRNFHYTMQQRMQELLSTKRDTIRYLVSSYAFNMPHDAIRQFSQRVDELHRALNRIIGHQVTLSSNNLQSLQKRIQSLHPNTVLKRGYTIIQKNGSIIGSASKLQSDDDVQIKFHDGKVPAKIK
jgi:exodeoxyribonuclease VII large subunit